MVSLTYEDIRHLRDAAQVMKRLITKAGFNPPGFLDVVLERTVGKDRPVEVVIDLE